MASSFPSALTTQPDAASSLGNFEHYEVRGRLGEGGYGEVYEAWDTKLCRTVAIKCIRHGGPPGADLLREARHAASLRHAAFVKVHAIESDGSNQFIVMELVHGRTLKSALADGKPPLATALDWVGQIADAMAAAHASGLVHGDLKPTNLMIEADGKIRILDFGLALRQDTLATATLPTGEPQGTIAYMAPERLLGAQPDARADVYALGVILYEMACGKRPFATLSGLALAAAQVQTSSDGWDYPDTLSAPIIALIRSMTAQRAEHRVAQMAEVLRRLAGLRVGAGDTAALPLQMPALAARQQRARATRIGAGVVVGALCIGAAAWGGLSYWESLSDKVAQVFTPYSEARALNQGLAALKFFDRPGALDAAQASFDNVLRHRGDNAAAVAGLSLVDSMRYGNDRSDDTWFRKAEASAQQAVKLNDQLALAHVAEAVVLESKDRFDEALAACTRALKLDPDNYFAWYAKVETLRHAHRYPEALAAVSEAIQRFPKERVFADELGSTRYQQHDDAAAEAAFRSSIRLEPDAIFAYSNLSATLMRQNRPDEALRVLQQGLQIRPSGALYGNLGNVLFLRGDYVGAADAFQNAVSPTRGAPQLYLNWANLGDALLWIPGREKEARDAYDQARSRLAPRLQRAPNDVALISRMSLYSARAGDKAEALRLIARATQLAPGNADVQFRAGLAYELLHDRKMALMAIATAKSLGYPVKYIEAEPDLVGLRRDPSYQQ